MSADADGSSIRVEGDVSGASLIIGDHNVVNVVYGTRFARPSGEIRPFRGLEAFDENSAQFFFGREEFVEQLLARFTAAIARSGDEGVLRFHAILGPSGSGKSSI